MKRLLILSVLLVALNCESTQVTQIETGVLKTVLISGITGSLPQAIDFPDGFNVYNTVILSSMLDMSSNSEKQEWRHHSNDIGYNVTIYSNSLGAGIEINSAGNYEDREYKILLGRLE